MVTTVADALAFLKKQKTRPIEGLARLGAGVTSQCRRHVENIAAERRFHTRRVAKRANRIAANIMRQPNPLQYVITQPYTADLVEAVWNEAYRLISKHLADKLCASWPYRVPSCYYHQSSWLDVRILDLPAAKAAAIYVPGQTRRGYTPNACVTISRRTVIQLWPSPVIDGAVITDIVPLGEGEFRASWLQQGRGNALQVVHGFIVSGMRFAVIDLDTARKMALRKKGTPATGL